MTEFDNSPASPFRITEITDELGGRTMLVDGNSAEAEALQPQEFWKLIIGESIIKAFTPPLSQNLQEFFGTEESPDELIVVSPLHDTSANSPIRTMFASCLESPSAISGAIVGQYLPACSWEERHNDIIISIEQGDWYSNVPHHDSDSTSYTVFRASKATLPKGFLSELNERLTQEQWEMLRQGLDQAKPAVE